MSLASLAAPYQRQAGVQSVMLGLTSTLMTSASLSSAQLRALDSQRFLQTVTWMGPESHALPSLLERLRTDHTQGTALPAIVDAATWNSLNLAEDNTFTMKFADTTLSFTAIARVQQIPTLIDSPDGSVGGGVLVDYQRLRAAYHNPAIAPAPNAIWLRTSDDSKALAHLRSLLTDGDNPLYLDHLSDRRSLAADFYQEPLSLTLIGVLGIGILTPLLLALFGNLLSSWLQASSRQTNFALLRALGASPRQIAATLGWEQGVIYGLALGVGTLFGAGLALLAAPSLVFTSMPTERADQNLLSGSVYQLQNTPSLHLVVPLSLALGLALLVLICACSLSMMIRLIMRSTLGEMLRLNED